MRSHFLRAAQQVGSGPENPFTLVGSSTVGNSTSGGTITATIPAGRMAGDFILVVHAARSAANLNMLLADPTYTTIADLYSDVSGSVDANLGVHWKISNGTETTLALPGGTGFTSAACSVQVWRGADLASPLDVMQVAATGISTGKAVNPGITTVTDGCLVLAAATNFTVIPGIVVSPPLEYTNATVSSPPSGTLVPRASIASKFSGSAGATSGGVWVIGSDSPSYSWCACTLALRPA
jgi:hypothetical protein